MNILLNRNITGTRRYIYYAILLFLIYEFLAKNFGLNRNFCYIVEFFSVILLLRHPYKLNCTELHTPFKIMIGLYITATLGAIINSINPFNFIMGFRGLFLSMVFLFASASYLYISDYHKLFDFFYKFQYLNVACTIFQYVIYHQTGDFNNGAFLSGNSQDIFCGALMAYYFYSYNTKKIKLGKLAFILISCIFIAIIQDERFIFIEAGIIFLYFSLTGKMTKRKISTAIVMAGVIIVGFQYLSSEQANTLNNINNILDYSQKTGAGYGLPRIGSSKIISDMFFDTPIKDIVGIGLGKGAENNLPLVDTSFYDKYGHLNYHYFTFQSLFLQTGWSGTILYVCFFACLIIYNFKHKRTAPIQYKYLYDISIIFTILCIILIWYNGSFRIFFGIFPYFILGIGPCLTRFLNKNKS